MIEGALGLVIAILLAVAFRNWRELLARQKELKVKLKRREKLEEELQQATDAVAMSVEELTSALERADEELVELQAMLNERERRLGELRARDPFDIVLFDKLALTVDNLWEVDISNKHIGDLAAAKMAPPDYLELWKQGRCFLVAASTEEDATRRCAARFPTSLGYHVDGVRPYRGLVEQPVPAAAGARG